MSPSRDPSRGASRPPLTGPQRKILDAIGFCVQKGDLPTVREVGDLVGLRSPATVYKHLQTLQKAGIIAITGKSRGIRFLSPEHLPGASDPSRPSGPARTPAGVPGVPRVPGVPIVGAIAAGQPFESYSDGFFAQEGGENWGFGDGTFEDGGGYESEAGSATGLQPGHREADETIPIDPSVFVDSGDVFALRVQGDSMVRAGILDGDLAIIRRQNVVEDGDIAAVIINGEGTLKRWRVRERSSKRGASSADVPRGSASKASASRADAGAGRKTVQLLPANEAFDPIEINEEDAKTVLIIGKYVGLVRGNLRLL